MEACRGGWCLASLRERALPEQTPPSSACPSPVRQGTGIRGANDHISPAGALLRISAGSWPFLVPERLLPG